MKGWYFSKTDRRLRYGDGRIAAVGVTHTVKGTPKCCERGLHASRRALDALRLGAGPVAFRVTLGGEIDHAEDKSAAQSRTYDAGGIDVTRTLVEFAACAAMGAMLLTDHDDARSWDAIEAVFAWLRGDVTRDELNNAAYAASAASNIARATALAATSATYAVDAAVDAAAASRAAACETRAASNIAHATATAFAAYAAAYAAASRAAACETRAEDELNDLLESMLTEALRAARTEGEG